MNTPAFQLHRAWVVASAITCLAGTACAQANEATAADAPKLTPFKLTTGLYQLSGGGAPVAKGLDVNLRYTNALGDLWLGVFRSPDLALSQTRGGWDNTYTWDIGGGVRFSPSLQAASGGFWGGSLGLETGDTWFAGVGLGRTNLRNYVNLNFDPNDAWMLSGGYRWSSARSLALQVVRDNRQNPDEQHVHLVYRTPLPEGQRLTLDGLYKKGLVAGVPIARTGLAVTYDWPHYFTRLAYDPKVNFTPQNMWRLSVGTRF